MITPIGSVENCRKRFLCLTPQLLSTSYQNQIIPKLNVLATTWKIMLVLSSFNFHIEAAGERKKIYIPTV